MVNIKVGGKEIKPRTDLSLLLCQDRSRKGNNHLYWRGRIKRVSSFEFTISRRSIPKRPTPPREEASRNNNSSFVLKKDILIIIIKSNMFGNNLNFGIFGFPFMMSGFSMQWNLNNPNF